MPAVPATKAKGGCVATDELACLADFILHLLHDTEELIVHSDAHHDLTVVTTTTFAPLVNVIPVPHPLAINPTMQVLIAVRGSCTFTAKAL